MAPRLSSSSNAASRELRNTSDWPQVERYITSPARRSADAYTARCEYHRPSSSPHFFTNIHSCLDMSWRTVPMIGKSVGPGGSGPLWRRDGMARYAHHATTAITTTKSVVEGAMVGSVGGREEQIRSVSFPDVPWRKLNGARSSVQDHTWEREDRRFQIEPRVGTVDPHQSYRATPESPSKPPNAEALIAHCNTLPPYDKR